MIGGVNPWNYGLNQFLGLRNKFHRVRLGECQCKVNIDCYNKNSYMEYLEFMKTPTVFGTEYDIIMLCEFPKVSIKVFSSLLFSDKQGMCHCEEPLVFGDFVTND
jgi:hypothetical protein